VALEALVAHFRDFSPSDVLPQADSGAALYRELVLERRGVCRHRAYGFVLTALGLGIPSRFVRNEAHAWVEVFDGKLWHRIDLGGAARRLDVDSRAGAPNHVPPADPYAWPENADSGAEAVRAGATRGPGNTNGSVAEPVSQAATPNPNAAASARAPTALQPQRTGPSTDVERPRSGVELSVDLQDARRGAPLRVSGVVSSGGAACPNARVDIVLVEPAGETLIGSVPTDAQGRFDSPVTIPFNIDVGEHTLRASTPGAGECGPSQ
jgi:transglutaminase-like putative cysteine protease